MKNTIAAIRNIIDLAAEMKNSYFWNPPASAGMRRNYEKNHSVDLIEWSEGGNTYTARFTTSCSCRYIYAHGIYTKNGAKTTLTAIKNSLKRLEAATV